MLRMTLKKQLENKIYNTINTVLKKLENKVSFLAPKNIFTRITQTHLKSLQVKLIGGFLAIELLFVQFITYFPVDFWGCYINRIFRKINFPNNFEDFYD